MVLSIDELLKKLEKEFSGNLPKWQDETIGLYDIKSLFVKDQAGNKYLMYPYGKNIYLFRDPEKAKKDRKIERACYQCKAGLETIEAQYDFSSDPNFAVVSNPIRNVVVGYYCKTCDKKDEVASNLRSKSDPTARFKA